MRASPITAFRLWILPWASGILNQRSPVLSLDTELHTRASLTRSASLPVMSHELDLLKSALADRYDVEHELGKGGMAVVYLARDKKPGRQVALKVLRPEIASVVGTERFMQEIKIAANLNHPQILPLLDSGRTGGRADRRTDEPSEYLYYVMPYVEGVSLRDKLEREKQLPIDESLEITKAVASALEYAHRRNIIHRDIKPENILIHDGQPVVADFGIALAMTEAGGTRITATGMSVGTPEYMSPEQATAERDLDSRSDIYALGCVLFEMLAGEPPYTGNSAQSVLAKMLTDPVPSVRRLRSAVSPGLDQALARALAKFPVDRFETAQEFAEALAKPGTTTRKSIAVLPLLSMSTDPENEFFADGITEDVTAQLSKIGALKVISRTSTMKYKNHEESLREIGATLGVGTVLEGSVRRAGNRVRIVVQLIDAESDEHLWAETYDRELTDVFAIQSDVALQIAGALEAELTADQKARIEKEPTKDLSAYQLYVKGCQHVGRFTRAELLQGIECLQQAVGRDPAFAHAYAHMAVGYVALGMGYGAGVMEPDEAYSKAKEAAARAIEIDPDLSEAHMALAFPMFVHDFEWETAETEFRRALELSPNAANTLDIYGLFLAAQMRYEEAIDAQRRAKELDPLVAWHSSDLASSMLRAGRYDEAMLEAKRSTQMEPGSPLGRAPLGWAYIMKQMYDEGLAELEGIVADLPDHTAWLGQLGQAYAISGRTEDARAMLRKLEELSRQRQVAPYHMAYVYTGLGEHEKALDALEQALEERSGAIYGVKGSFLFAPLRSHPRFKALLRKINLEEDT